MEAFYSVTWKGNDCGKVSVKQQGLYYHFQCRCIVDREDIYRLILSYGTNQKSLGILVPYEGSFILTTRLPVKKIKEGDWTFQIISKRNISTGCFIPISPEEPFAYISHLKNSFLVYQNGQAGIQYEKMQE